MLPCEAAMALNIDPDAEAQLSLADLDVVILALFILAGGTASRGRLCNLSVYG